MGDESRKNIIMLYEVKILVEQGKLVFFLLFSFKSFFFQIGQVSWDSQVLFGFCLQV